MFRNDYSEIAHPKILEALLKASTESYVGYGVDELSELAANNIKKAFSLGDDSSVFFVSGGTQANMTVLSFLLRPYEAVICADTGHINVHETGAVEASGHKVLTTKNNDGKIVPSEIKKIFKLHGDEHMVKPSVVYISDSTETGTVYTKSELLEIRKVCDELGLLLYIDGARLGVALTVDNGDVTPSFFASIPDVFYVGGTKNGLTSGEAIVIKDKKLAENFRYHIKNKGAMLAKGFVLGAQFSRAFEDNLYFEMAKNSNDTANYIRRGISGHVNFVGSSNTNQIFIEVNKELGRNLMDKFQVELWEERDSSLVVRIVTCFATKQSECDELIKEIVKY